jgi:hypothetical protein
MSAIVPRRIAPRVSCARTRVRTHAARSGGTLASAAAPSGAPAIQRAVLALVTVEAAPSDDARTAAIDDARACVRAAREYVAQMEKEIAVLESTIRDWIAAAERAVLAGEDALGRDALRRKDDVVLEARALLDDRVAWNRRLAWIDARLDALSQASR